jgi:hypothetical protein
LIGADPQSIRAELLLMAAEDLRVREELARTGVLFDGYHPRMRELHESNAARLAAIMDEHGWPGISLVGAEAAEAAWLVLQHAIGNPSLQRRGLQLLQAAADRGDASRVHVAKLEDRIRSSEGKGQLYGTQFDWDEQGLMSPLPCDDERNVDRRRSEIGLPPLAQDTEQKRREAAESGMRAPRNWSARQREKEDWLRATGWRR